MLHHDKNAMKKKKEEILQTLSSGAKEAAAEDINFKCLLFTVGRKKDRKWKLN